MATYTTRTTVIASLLIGALLVPFLQDTEATAITRPSFTTTANKATAATPPSFSSSTDEAAYGWTQDLFSTAGFDFPIVAIEFHRNEEACGGVRGRTHFTDEDLATIVVCATHHNPEVEDIWRQRTLLHEVAHAWIDQNVGEERTDALMELRGTETWLSRDQIWQDRGAEHAAEILMWGLQDGDYGVDFRIDNTECSDLSAGYELLTGVALACDVAST